MDVIDHPLFQRMRRINQLGLLHYAWPTATHTRFEHSIGVCHMSQMMLDALLGESGSDAIKLYPLKNAQNGQAVRFHELDKNTREQLTRLTRITALVHDIGHGPLSHSFDSFAPKTDDVEALLDDERLDAIRPLAVHITRGKHGRVRHESVSCILFAKLWHDLGGELWIPQAVAIVLLGDKPGTDAVPENIRPWLSFVRDIVSSAPIDADRMDYLLRDSHALGVSYGLYEPDRILKSILSVHMDGQYRLGWRFSGLRAIESFIVSRFYMFAQCYTHKTYRASTLMLEAIQLEAGRLQLQLVRADTLSALVADYTSLSDESFLATLKSTPVEDAGRLVHLTRNLLNRELWKRLHDFEADEAHLVERVVKEMKRRYPEERFILDRKALEAMKDLEHGSYLVRMDRNGKYSLAEKRSWLEASPIMRTLRDDERSCVRLYMETHGPERSHAKRMREEAIALVCELRETCPIPE